MKRTFLAAAAVLLLSATAPAAVDEKAIDSLVQRARQAFHVPGVAVAVVKDGKVVYLKGHGRRDIGKKDAVTPATLFPIASCTKAFTTTGLGILVDEGKAGWDDKVRKHVPYFRLSDPLADRDVRLRDLLCHRTGLGPHLLLWYRAPWSQEEIVRRAGRLPLDKPFRTAFQYQSTMFNAAGAAVASAAKMPWDVFVRKRLLDPIGMRDTVFTTPAALKSADRATPHHFDTDGQVGVMPRYPLTVPDPAGSVHSSARDLAKWLLFHLGDGSAGGRRIVSAAALAETHSPQMVARIPADQKAQFPDTVQLSYGLGWVVFDRRGHPLIGHGGAIDGFRTYLVMAPKEKLGIAVLSNLDQTHMNLALANSLLDLLLGLPKRDWNALYLAEQDRLRDAELARGRALAAARRKGTRPSRELSAYAGKYAHEAYGSVRVSLQRGELVWRWNDLRGRLRHWYDDTFLLDDEAVGLALVQFRLDGSKAVASMKVAGRLGVEFRRLRQKKR
jgi:CubicO group peptidase (beta-lactamase class C family)